MRDDLEDQWNKKVFGGDIVKRLRLYIGEPIGKEAADEIERLRAQNEQLDAALKKAAKEADDGNI